MAQTFDPSEGVWRTIGGRKVFIRNGQSLSQAMIESGKFKNIREDYKTAKEKEEEEKQKKLEEEQKANKERNYRFDFGFKDGKALRNEAFDDAKAYLEEEDMAQYLDDDLKEKISSIKYVLDDVDAVHVDITANDKLSDEDLGKLKSFIEGQNSDGLGEGFEQQDFAEAYYDPDTGDGPYTYQEVMDIVSENFDNMDFDEYRDYIEYDDIRMGLEEYVNDGYGDYTFEDYLVDNDYVESEDEVSNKTRDELIDDYPDAWDSYLEDEESSFLDSGYAEDYIPQTAIDNAKDEVARNDPRYNENLWNDGMTSMEWDINDAKDVTPEKEGDTARDIQYKNDETGNYESVNDAIRNMSAKEANDFVEELNDWGRINNEDYKYLKEKIGYEKDKGFTDEFGQHWDNEADYEKWLEEEGERVEQDNKKADEWLKKVNPVGSALNDIRKSHDKAQEAFNKIDKPNKYKIDDEATYEDEITGETRKVMNREEFEKEMSEDPHRNDYADTSYEGYINSLNDAGIISDEQANQLKQKKPAYQETMTYDEYRKDLAKERYEKGYNANELSYQDLKDIQDYGESKNTKNGNNTNKYKIDDEAIYNGKRVRIAGIDHDAYGEDYLVEYLDNDFTGDRKVYIGGAEKLTPANNTQTKNINFGKRESLLDEYTVSEVALAFNSTKDNKGYAVEKVAKSLEDSKMKYQISPGNVGSDKVNIEISEGDNKGKIILTRDGAKISGDFTHKQLNKINNALNVWNKYKDNNKNVEYDFNNGKWLDKGKSMNDTLRESAYNKYMKEHPGSKMTLEEFLKKK